MYVGVHVPVRERLCGASVRLPPLHGFWGWSSGSQACLLHLPSHLVSAKETSRHPDWIGNRCWSRHTWMLESSFSSTACTLILRGCTWVTLEADELMLSRQGLFYCRMLGIFTVQTDGWVRNMLCSANDDFINSQWHHKSLGRVVLLPWTRQIFVMLGRHRDRLKRQLLNENVTIAFMSILIFLDLLIFILCACYMYVVEYMYVHCVCR